MRDTIYGFCIVFVCLTSCNKSSETSLSLFIKNATGNEVILKDNQWKNIDTIELINGVANKVPIKINESGYYYLLHNNNSLNLYLKASTDLRVEFDNDSLYQSLKFFGAAKNENNYLLKEKILTLNFGPEIIGYSVYANLPEEKFLKQSDSIFELYSELFKGNKEEFHHDFKYLHSESIKIRKALRLSQFQMQKRMVTKNENFKVSENFPNPFLDIDLNDPELLKTTEYLDLLHSYFDDKILLITKKNDTADYYIEYIKTLNNSGIHSSIKDLLMHKISSFAFSYSKNPKGFLELFVNTTSNNSLIKETTKSYEKSIIKKGKLSPGFTFKDIQLKAYSLSQFKGKLIYIDLWASWCSPCISEFKHLKELKAKFKNHVNFISIAWKDDLENWKYSLTKHNLDGVQLFSKKTDDPFFKFYNVTYIPRFILLDSNGIILDDAALPPSKIDFDDWL